jgi:predicted GNAT superfamily acetyltransferase
VPSTAVRAADAAQAAARAAGVHVREVAQLDELARVTRLFGRIWQPVDGLPVTLDLLIGMAKAGSYVAGAYDGPTVDAELAGACIGFFGPPTTRSLHSHIAAVIPPMLGRRVGFALKLHQRAWALAHDVDEVLWTYDPLVGRNAYFNTTLLGAEPIEYLVNFYGVMDDGINGTDESDRLVVRWALSAPRVVATCSGQPPPEATPEGAEVLLAVGATGDPESLPSAAPVVLVEVPRDIAALRKSNQARAARWRTAVRDVLGGLLADGARVRGFDRRGWYVVERGVAS